jgi:ketosteroid isomerase-like protein
MATTQVEVSNIAMIRRGYDAFNAGDAHALSDLYAPDATWRGAPAALGGDLSGRDAIMEMFAKIARETDNTFRAVPTAYAAAGDLVFVHMVVTGKRQGRSLESEGVLVFRVTQELIRDARLFDGDPRATDAFWA